MIEGTRLAARLEKFHGSFRDDLARRRLAEWTLVELLRRAEDAESRDRAGVAGAP